MLYADDVGIISLSPGRLQRMVGVIVTSCATFNVTISEIKKEIVCLQTKGAGRCCSLSVAVGWVYRKDDRFSAGLSEQVYFERGYQNKQ